jgi:hypothetical protein
MSRDWKLTAEDLQDMLLVRKVIISPLIGEELEKDETSESIGSGRTEAITEDGEVYKAPREK